MSVRGKEKKLSPLLKYPGGKEKELKYILPNLPQCSGSYFEPFIGGGAVYFAIESERYYINDKSTELVNLYRMVQQQNPEFLRKTGELETFWTGMDDVLDTRTEALVRLYLRYKQQQNNAEELEMAVRQFVQRNVQAMDALLEPSFPIAIENFHKELVKSLKNKMLRMNKLEQEKGRLAEDDVIRNLEGAVKNAIYMHFRYLYNHASELELDVPLATTLFFFLREYCYASMFRYNTKGEFNVPYGGISYNKKPLARKVQYFAEAEPVAQLRRTVVENMDFEEFFHTHVPEPGDFVFLDPPYDTEFSTYAGNEFGREDQIRLADYLIKECRASFMLIIKNTDFIRGLYPAGRSTANDGMLYVSKFDKKYVVSFQDRNDKDAEHLLITNYPLQG